MTHVEAILKVEAQLTSLGLKDKWGEPVQGLDAIGYLARIHGRLLERVEDDFEAGVIGPDKYATAMEMLIEEARRHKFRGEIENEIAAILRAQGGAA